MRDRLDRHIATSKHVGPRQDAVGTSSEQRSFLRALADGTQQRSPTDTRSSTLIGKRDLLVATAAATLGAAASSRSARAQADRPGIVGAFETAEAAFVFGLPIVMNYAVMYEYAVDRTSSQFKAPFNTIWNDAQVFTWR